MNPFNSLTLLLLSTIGVFSSASSSSSSSGSGSGSGSSSSDDAIVYRVFGSAGGDAEGCFDVDYFDEEGAEQLGTLRDCVTSETTFLDEFFTTFRFEITSTFTPNDDDEDPIVSQCNVTVSPLPGGVDEDGFNAMEECFNENGVLSGAGGSVALDGRVDNTQFSSSGVLTFDLLWTFNLDDSSGSSGSSTSSASSKSKSGKSSKPFH